MPHDLLDRHRRIENGQLGEQQNRRSARHSRDLRQNLILLAQAGILTYDERSGFLDLLDARLNLVDVRLHVVDHLRADCRDFLRVKTVLLLRSGRTSSLSRRPSSRNSKTAALGAFHATNSIRRTYSSKVQASTRSVLLRFAKARPKSLATRGLITITSAPPATSTSAS